MRFESLASRWCSRGPSSDRERHLDRAERGDMLVAHAAVGPAGLDEADLKPALGRAEANEHCRSGTE
jgi:hypothetical protein